MSPEEQKKLENEQQRLKVRSSFGGAADLELMVLL
jgi:hypothetical protein